MRDVYTDPEHGATVSLIECQDVGVVGPTWMVSAVEVDHKYRRQGAATRLLRKVCKDADRESVILILAVTPDGTGPDFHQLVDWYARFGFRQWHEETDDPDTMIRLPVVDG